MNAPVMVEVGGTTDPLEVNVLLSAILQLSRVHCEASLLALSASTGWHEMLVLS